MQLNLEIVRFQQEAKARDRAEMRELLEKILLSNDDRRMLVNAEEPGDLHEVMQVLQKVSLTFAMMRLRDNVLMRRSYDHWNLSRRRTIGKVFGGCMIRLRNCRR